MAESRSASSKSSTSTSTSNGSSNGTSNGSRNSSSNSGGGVALLSNAQDAATLVKNTAEKAAERWPEVATTAQTAARDTQRALERMPNQGLIAGTSFSLGLGIGLFMTGANRLLVVVAMAPAVAMAATLLARDEEPAQS